MRVTFITFAALLSMAGIASAQYGYSVQGPPPAGAGVGGAPQYTPGYSPSSPAYAPANPTFDPNMGMGTTNYGGPAYTGQQQNYPPQPGYGAAPVSAGMLTYGQLEVDYKRTTYSDKKLAASDGVAISLMTELFHPFFLHFGADFSTGTEKSLSAKNYDMSTFTLGGGGFFAITNRLHLTGEIGFLYSNLSTSKSNLSFSDGAVYMMPGVRFAATDSLELDGHLTATSADKYDSFIFDLGGYYKIFAQMDLGLNVGFGDQSTTYKAGVRFRW